MSLNKPSRSSGNATFTFEEVIERLSLCSDREELDQWAIVLWDEKDEYSHFHLLLITEAVRLMRLVFPYRTAIIKRIKMHSAKFDDLDTLKRQISIVAQRYGATQFQIAYDGDDVVQNKITLALFR